MELKWLEDYCAVVKYQNFSEAAKSRHLTQPAFSRRIRMLEAWLDVTLINRDVNPIQLAPAGMEFLPKAEKIIDQIYESQEKLRYFVQGRSVITILTQHSLMVSHVPLFLESLQPILDNVFVRFIANDQHDSVQQFLDKKSDFLLCFSALGLPQRLSWVHIEKLQISSDILLPVSATDDKGEALHKPEKIESMRILSYPKETFLRRLIDQNGLCSSIPTQVVFENALSAGLKIMVQKGYGMAWLPKSLIELELKNKELVSIANEYLHAIPLEINLYQHKGATSSASQNLWNICEKLG